MKTETENLRELDAEMHRICGWAFDESRLCWHRGGYWTMKPNRYTEGENVLEVLEKCAEKLDDEDKEETISIGLDAPYFVVEKTNCIPNLRTDGPSLPLTICKFAKALCSK